MQIKTSNNDKQTKPNMNISTISDTVMSVTPDLITIQRGLFWNLSKLRLGI